MVFHGVSWFFMANPKKFPGLRGCANLAPFQRKPPQVPHPSSAGIGDHSAAGCGPRTWLGGKSPKEMELSMGTSFFLNGGFSSAMLCHAMPCG